MFITKNSSISALLLLLSPSLWPVSANAEAKESKAETKAETSVTSSSSENPRYSLGLGAAYFLSVEGIGAEVGYALGDELKLNVMHLSGSKDLFDESASTVDITAQAKINSSITQVSARYFISKSFALNLGLGYRQVSYDLSVYNRYGLRADSQGYVMGPYASAAIGNTWNFGDSFYFGVDWLSLAMPFANEVDSGTQTNIEGLKDEEESLKKAWQGAASQPFGSLLNVRAGVLF